MRNNTFDCTKTCEANQRGEHEILQEGGNNELAANSRCVYKVDWSNKNDTSERLLMIASEMVANFASNL